MSLALYNVFLGISYFIRILSYALVIYCILSWILPPYHKVMQFFSRIVDPMLNPVRRVMFRIFPRMPLDLSPIALSMLLSFATRLLWRVYVMLL